jgi:hypothetical protein
MEEVPSEWAVALWSGSPRGQAGVGTELSRLNPQFRYFRRRRAAGGDPEVAKCPFALAELTREEESAHWNRSAETPFGWFSSQPWRSAVAAVEAMAPRHPLRLTRRDRLRESSVGCRFLQQRG